MNTVSELLLKHKITVQPDDRVEQLPSGEVIYYQDSRHMYFHLLPEPPKRHLSAVSSIVKFLGSSEGLVYWAWDLGMQGIDYRSVRDERGTSGTSIHKAFESLAKDGTVPNVGDFPEEDRTRVQAVANFWMDKRPKVIATEIIVADLELGYAGRFDLLCEIDGVKWLVDLKTGKRVYTESHFQLALYLGAMEACGRDVPERAAIVRAETSGAYEFVECGVSMEQARAVVPIFRALKKLDDDAKAAKKALKAAA